MGLIKIFSGTETMANELQSQIEALEIEVVKKQNLQSNASPTSKIVMELFIQEINFHKANPVLEAFRMSL